MKKNFLSLSIVLLTGLLFNLSNAYATPENDQEKLKKEQEKAAQTK